MVWVYLWGMLENYGFMRIGFLMGNLIDLGFGYYNIDVNGIIVCFMVLRGFLFFYCVMGIVDVFYLFFFFNGELN